MTKRQSQLGTWKAMTLAGVLVCAACSSKYGAVDALDPVDAPASSVTPPSGDPAQDSPLTPLDPTASDAGEGGAPTSTHVTCDPSRPFASITDVDGFAYPEGNYGPPRLSPDELTLFVPMQTSQGVALSTATRSSRSGAFGPPAPFAGLATGGTNSYQLSPNLSTDGLALVFEGMPGTANRVSSIFVASRTSMYGSFGLPVALPVTDQNPTTPYLLGNGGAAYYSANGRIQRAALTSMRMQGGPSAIAELGDPTDGAVGERFPVVRDDELAIYWQASKTGGTVGTSDLYVATRSSKSEPFGAKRAVTELDAPAVDEYPAWLSADGCRLYVVVFDPNGGSPTAKLRIATLTP